MAPDPLRHGLLGFVYSGDILTVYALLGLPLMIFYRVSDRWLLELARCRRPVRLGEPATPVVRVVE